MDRAGWQAKMDSIEFWVQWCNDTVPIGISVNLQMAIGVAFVALSVQSESWNRRWQMN